MKYLSVNPDQSLSLSTTEKPTCGANQCLIKVHAIGVNRADILQKQGKYPAPAGESEILGLEVSGEIVEVGTNVKQWQCCERVYGLVAGGGYAEFVVIEASHLLPIPKGFTYVQAAAIAETFLTAYQSLFMIAQLQKGEKVLIHAGASGVGSAAILLAKQKQCDVVVTVGSKEKGEQCLLWGADHYICYQHEDFEQWKKQQLPSGFNVIIDFIGGQYVAKNVSCAALDGRIVMLAMLGERFADNIDVAQLLMKRVSIVGSTLRNRTNDYKTQLIQQFLTDFSAELSTDNIMPIIDSTYPWQEADKAHQKMMANENIGKLVLVVTE